ncbi:hypothetical protein HMF8227_01673 [Saliniradius amylolyticus]|uniref:ABC-type transport auxiliary lipoprotein component domain-containing protein n=1 Tax=Saliniradius amylolyticus TaxID=2183582 RepID=A0A2S2E3B2_9ALTE|nr:PqiC family protein [Saliniradius amylolyticus]AWL12146.1 hypothetical protein HMF8227_01673 [Saliniradius amylolyticus]
MKSLSLVFMAGLLMACTSAPQSVNYYSLSQASASMDGAGKTDAEALIVLSRPQLADYLRQSFLVMQTGPHQLHFARQHVWAQNLASSIEQVLVQHLNHTMDNTAVLTTSDPRAPQVPSRLQVEIEHLLPSADGHVNLKARYWFTGPDGQTQAHSFNHQLPLNDAGYAHAVQQMHSALTKLAEAMAKVVQPQD